jgi:hypothetical protein
MFVYFDLVYREREREERGRGTKCERGGDPKTPDHELREMGLAW